MAGDWMKVELDLPDKPEVHYIAGALNISTAEVVGHLIRIWAWFDKHTEDGHAYGVTYALLDRITGVTGLGEVMMLAGWMEQHDKTLCMPKFDRHTSESAKKRALAASRQSRKRHAESVTKTLPEKRREENKKHSAFALPDWVPPDAWSDFVEMRNKSKHPLTEKAMTLIVGDLDRLRGDGFDPRAVLDEAIKRGWRGVFPINGQPALKAVKVDA
jgi:hypothetical protein